MLSRFIKRGPRRVNILHYLRSQFSTSQEIMELPIVDISSFLEGGEPNLSEAEKLVNGLKELGALAIKDPRVEESKNVEFLDMMEGYFESRSKIFYEGGDLKECFPNYGYQVGVTPELVERARYHEDTIAKFFKNDPPTTPQPPPKDGKWRYFWRIGEVDQQDELLLPPQVVPDDIPRWTEVMDSWGNTVNFFLLKFI